MHLKKLAVCASAAALALAVACGKNSPAPTSPSAAAGGDASAAADGSTLKATAPTAVSPINNQKPDSQVVLVINNASMKFMTGAAVALSYQFEISSGSTVVYTSPLVASGSGQTSHIPTATLTANQAYSWRARASYQGSNGPWSSSATFIAPESGYIRGNEVVDPLTTGKTVGEIRGPVQWVDGVGLKLLEHGSNVLYRLPQNLQAGEFSVMILGADEGSEGSKSKVFAMQEGPDEADLTDDDYRMTAELRGRDYGAPGSVTFRIICGDGVSRDGQRIQLNFSSSRWYFWRFSWTTGRATLEVREDGPTGRAIYTSSTGTGSHPYRPTPHYVYLGAPIGRAGPDDATLPGGTYKNLYVGPNTRPAFAQ